MDSGISQFECSLEAILAAESLGQLDAVVRDFRNIHKFTNIVLHVTRVADPTIENPLLLLTYPDEWVTTYTENDYFSVDPVVQAGKHGFLPFDWKDLDRSSAPVREMFRQADKFDIGRQGITLPIRGPFGERSLVSVTANLSEREWSRYRYICMRELQVLAHYLHDRAVSLAGLRTSAPPRRLSPREGQCLRMVSLGLMPKQIAGRLSLSESAVRLYLKSARFKLNAKTINHAIAKAANLELFDVSDSLLPPALHKAGARPGACAQFQS